MDVEEQATLSRIAPSPYKVFKLQRGEPEPEEEDSPCTEERDRDIHGGSPRPRRRYYPTGLATTGLEPIVTICIKDAPLDELIDMSANYSMTDSRLCEYLYSDVILFQYDIPYCMGIEGACITKSLIAILG